MIGKRGKTSDRNRLGLAARATLVLAAGLLFAIPLASADGQTIDGLNEKLGAARSQANALGADIEAKILALAESRNQAAMAAAREERLTETLERGQQRSARFAEDLAVARAELAAARARLDRALAALADRLVAIYKSGAISDVDVLLEADGYEDLAMRAGLLDRIQDADRALAERVRDLRAELAARTEAVEQAKARSDALNAQIAAARDQISAARAQAEARASALANARSAQGAALARLQSRMAGWSRQVQQLERVPAVEAQQQVSGWTNDGDWSIPEAIVMCESGGNYQALNASSGAGGAYQIMPSTWQLYGGKGKPHQASPAEQDRIAAQIWADSGPGAWVCAG